MKRIRVLSIGILAVGVCCLASAPAFADDCVALGGAIVGTECQITVAVSRTGTYNLDETLRITGTGSIDASAGTTGITLNICVAPAVPSPSCDLILETPTVLGGGQIKANDDDGAPNDDASPITLNASRDVLMQAGTKITTENQDQGGSGGAITMTAGNDMTMCGPAGAKPGCGGASGNAGALISSRNLSATTAGSNGGYITIDVGDVNTASGDFYMEGGVTAYGLETGAKILSTATLRAGDISVTAGGTYFAEPGSVVEAGGPTGNGTANQQGAKIFLVSDCGLTSQGRVTSKGPDPGADLVHLESCTVLIEGLVESTGKGHAENAPNSCDLVADGLVGEVLRDHPAESTGCIEVWGNFITIDSFNVNPATGLPWAGELNSDIGDGGATGTSWIDIFAFSELTVTDGTGNDRISDNLGHTYFSVYAVHANTINGSDNNPSVVTALVKNGPLTASGKAFEASATLNADTGHGPPNPDPFVGNGSDGGTIRLEASGTVTLDDAFVNASGDFVGTPPNGGHIIVSAWGAGSDLLWRNGDGDVRPIATGEIELNACDLIDTTGTEFHGEDTDLVTPMIITSICDATKPTIPTIAIIDGGPVFKANLWALCGGGSSVSGIKFNDLDGDHFRDLGEPGLDGWVIHIFNSDGSVHQTQTTAGGGNYTFTSVPDGTYTVCEQLVTNWAQTFPTAGANCVAPGDPAGDNSTPGPIGYTVVVTSGTDCAGLQITGRDFGNRLPQITCPEDPNRAAKLTRTVKPSQEPGGGGIPGNPANYTSVQSAYDAAKVSLQVEVIGLFSSTTENLVLNGSKSLTITQCTSARVTGESGVQAPVWDVTSTGKLTIVGPDSVGGTIGWRIAGNGGHTIKSLRASGASQYGVLVLSNSNTVSWNEIKTSPVGLRVEGDSNKLTGGTIQYNTGDGAQLAASANNNTFQVSNVQLNGGNGILVAGGPANVIKDGGRVDSNGLNGILVTGNGNTIKNVAAGSDAAKGNGTLNTFNPAALPPVNIAGINVTGNSNTLDGDQTNANQGYGVFVAGTSTTIKNTQSNKGNSGGTKENTAAEYRFTASTTNGGSNKKDNLAFSSTVAGTYE